VANLRETAASPSFQQFSRLEKAGGGVEPLGRTPKKNHPVQIVRKMPLAYDNQRAPTVIALYFQSAGYLVRPFFPLSCARSLSASGAQVGICLFLSFERVRLWSSPKLSIYIVAGASQLLSRSQ
jgi:hypothetical protein